MYANSVRNALLNAIYLPIVITAGSVGTGLALWQGGVRIGDVSLGTLVAFMQYAAFFYVPIQELAARFTQVQVAQASAERLQGLLDTRPEIRDAPDALDDGLASRRARGGVRAASPSPTARARRCSATSTCGWGRARRSLWSAPPAAARPPS